MDKNVCKNSLKTRLNSHMKRYIYTAVVFLTLGILAACSSKSDQSAKAQAGSTTTPEVKQVLSIEVPRRDVTTFKTYPTDIQGIINSQARPKIAGYITDVLVDEGQRVRKGQVLFRLETSALTQQAQAAKASINVAQVKVDQLKPLVAQGIVSENQLATAKANLQQAKSNYHSIQANIAYATVRSPVNGYVGKIRKRKGNLVSPNDPQPLTTVTDISEVYAYFSMNEKDYLNFLLNAEGETRQEKIKNMPKVTLILANRQEYEHKGTIQTINSQIDPQTGTITFRAIFDNPELLLTNGSTGQIKIPKVHKDVLVVPQKSTYELQDHTFVVKVEKSDTATIAVTKTIQILGEKGNLFIVGDGIKEGDEIVAEGVGTVRSGTLIKPVLQPFDSIAKPLPQVFK